MDNKQLEDLIDGIRSGKVSTEAALRCLKKLPFEDLGYAKVDHHRCLRNGVPEVIYCAGKTMEQVKGIVERMLPHHSNILATRADRGHYEAIRSATPDLGSAAVPAADGCAGHPRLQSRSGRFRRHVRHYVINSCHSVSHWR